MAHTFVKPEKLVLTGVGMLSQELVLPKLMKRESLDQFKGVAGDTITYRVPGVLPGRDYAFRNDRSADIIFDEYAETTVAVTLSGNAYSAVHLTDEQVDFDLANSGPLLEAQTRAVATKLQHAASDAVTGQTYAVTIGNAGADLKGALIEARRVLNTFGVTGNRVLVVGSGFEAELLNDAVLSLASNVSDAEAVSQLREATIGRRYGFTIVVDMTIGANDAYALSEDAFIMATATPSIPKGVSFGASASYDGVALRLIRDYDPNKLRDRQVVNTYYGFRAVVDTIVYWDKVPTIDQEKVSTAQHFVRGIKLTLGGTSTYPAGGSPLNLATGIAAPA